MTSRTARCACCRVKVTVEGEPLAVLTCHCDFCQKRTGSVFSVGAHFTPEQVVAISGETKTYNGLEIDGVGGPNGVGIDYIFCATCGSTVYWNFAFDDQSMTGIAVGNFVDPDFPASLVAAGMLSVLIFPALSLAILRREPQATVSEPDPA